MVFAPVNSTKPNQTKPFGQTGNDGVSNIGTGTSETSPLLNSAGAYTAGSSVLPVGTSGLIATGTLLTTAGAIGVKKNIRLCIGKRSCFTWQ
ncbi:hypothetical protein AVEN_258152-1 [Araneus ventricosus]|uniref:Uncharacterized protein n=1 Tax=Araneus ventricosus TaxID=182803 RepID=A0A4Y2CZF8_ARAVE|nr:hypothetical protein AVEN_258152-1 [Araneus ventricosus]